MARRFQFRLETLLRVRQLHEREAKRNVAGKRAEIARLDLLNEQTAAEISRQQAELVSAQQGRVDPRALQVGRAWVAHLRRTTTVRQIQRADLVRQLDELQAALREACKQARIIEKLRERRWTEYRRDRQRAEQAAADELAQQLQGYARE